MRIGELAKRAGVSVQAVRFYERRRLMRTLRHRGRYGARPVRRYLWCLGPHVVDD